MFSTVDLPAPFGPSNAATPRKAMVGSSPGGSPGRSTGAASRPVRSELTSVPGEHRQAADRNYDSDHGKHHSKRDVGGELDVAEQPVDHRGGGPRRTEAA